MNELLHSQSRFVRPVVRNFKNEWRYAALEALQSGAPVSDVRTRQLVTPWKPGA